MAKPKTFVGGGSKTPPNEPKTRDNNGEQGTAVPGFDARDESTGFPETINDCVAAAEKNAVSGRKLGETF